MIWDILFPVYLSRYALKGTTRGRVSIFRNSLFRLLQNWHHKSRHLSSLFKICQCILYLYSYLSVYICTQAKRLCGCSFALNELSRMRTCYCGGKIKKRQPENPSKSRLKFFSLLFPRYSAVKSLLVTRQKVLDLWQFSRTWRCFFSSCGCSMHDEVQIF